MKLDLAEIKKRLHARNVLAITLESARLAVSLVRREGEVMQTVQSFSLPVSDQQVLSDPEKAGRELAAALEAAGIRERDCAVCVPPGWALTATTDLPEVSADDLRGYLELRAEREFSVPGGELRLGYCAYALPGGKQRATLAALTTRHVESIEQMLEMSRRTMSSLSLALDKCIIESEPLLHFLTNGNHTDVVITAGGGVAGLRSLPGPGGEAFDPASFCRDVRITLGRLPEEVRQQIRTAEFEGPSAQKLCTATRANLQRMGIESPACDLAPDTADTAKTGQTKGAAVEAAQLMLRKEPVAFEFIVPETTRMQEFMQRFDTTRRRRIVFGVVGVILALILMFIIRSEYESHLQSRWDAMSGDAADLDALQQKIREYRPWFEPAPEGLQVMESLATAFPDAGDVWAKSIQVTSGHKVTCTGFARTQTALMALLDRLRARPDVSGVQVQQLRGENPVQFSIIFQWEEQHGR